MSTALIVGKFYPPHAGHHYVINQAIEECDNVIVIVLWSETESIRGYDRRAWLQIEHPGIAVLETQDEYVTNYDDPQAWDNHMRVIRDTLDKALWYRSYNQVTDVYGSEEYVIELASRFEATPHVTDLNRIAFPTSGTAIRADIRRNWEYLAPITKAELCKRIVCVGAESCGTTTLARDLASLWNTVWVPEYGRTYSEGMGHHATWSHRDLEHIGTTQMTLENRMASHSRNGLLICDTNILATAIWDKFLVGDADWIKYHFLIDQSKADLYILTDFCPWEDDGFREGEGYREAMQARFKLELDAQHVPWIEVTGTSVQRLNDASARISELLLDWKFTDPIPEETNVSRCHACEDGGSRHADNCQDS